MEIITSVDRFDFEGFLAEAGKILVDSISPDGLVEYVENGQTVCNPDVVLTAADCMEHLEKPDTRLYVTFGVSDLSGGVRCADGEYRAFATESEEESDPLPDNTEENSLTSDSQDVGYLFSRRDEQLVIQSAYRYMGGCPMPPPCADVLEDAEILPFYGDSLERFARRFVKS